MTPARSRFAGAAALGLAALTLLSACAAPASDAGDDTADAATSLLPAAEGTTEYPLTIDTWGGETVLEERPQRVAVVGFSTNFDFLEALDVVPVYAITEESEWEWRDPEWLEAIEFTDTATRRDPINYESIAASDPDVIVALNFVFEQAEWDQLTDIAPVLEYDEQYQDQADWREGQRIVGEALDLSAAADAAIEEADAAIAEVAASHPEFAGLTATIGTDYGPEYGFDYYTPTGGTAEGIMGDLGFAPNPLAEQFVADPVISDENVAQLDGDVLIVIYQDEAVRTAREAQPLFQQIPAVQDGRYVSLASDEEGVMLTTADGETVSNATWVLRRGASALSLPWAVDVIANQWLAGIDLS